MWPLVLILVITVLVLVLARGASGFATTSIPKRIWTYWDDDELPEFVKKSVDSWRRYSPDWEVVVVTPKTLSNFLPNLNIKNYRPGDFVQRRSDMIRLHLIAEYGGVWSDATVVVRRSHDELTTGDYDLIGYYRESFTTNNDYPVIENWLFAAPPSSGVVTRWRDEFAKTADYENITEYIDSVKNRGVDLQGIPDPGYLTPYVSLQSVLQTEMTVQEIKNKIKVIKSDDGPFRHATVNGWDPEKSMKWLCTQSTSDTPPVVKIYGNERREVEQNPELRCVYKIFD